MDESPHADMETRESNRLARRGLNARIRERYEDFPSAAVLDTCGIMGQKPGPATNGGADDMARHMFFDRDGGYLYDAEGAGGYELGGFYDFGGIFREYLGHDGQVFVFEDGTDSDDIRTEETADLHPRSEPGDE